MEKDATYTVNRQELIRMARESCEGNLRPNGNGRFSQGLCKKGTVQKKSRSTGNVGKGKVGETTILQETDRKRMAIKFLLIRTICVSVVFLFIVVIDQFQIGYESFQSETILQTVQSNQLYEQAQELFEGIQDEKIVNVFHGLE
ncbi:hypothetical protein [Anaerosporobacter faecicola]|uniref:hypothetical protein n=1 Tax=Anaerosporobacter faecicola TaxID=2718714 RepID=UPI00143A57E6|nr:hypothetical protein [Anaerosporobacter faecicola]